MWALDPVNSSELIEQLRPHGRDGNFEVAWVGEGWRTLVEECHQRLVAAFPDYELLDVKQKWGLLEYQAFPQRWVKGEMRWTDEESDLLEEITDEIRTRSELVCEWCGEPGGLREERRIILTLCDACNQHHPDPPYSLAKEASLRDAPELLSRSQGRSRGGLPRWRIVAVVQDLMGKIFQGDNKLDHR